MSEPIDRDIPALIAELDEELLRSALLRQQVGELEADIERLKTENARARAALALSSIYGPTDVAMILDGLRDA